MNFSLIIVLSMLTLAQDETIRKEHWGMTQNEVIAVENPHP